MNNDIISIYTICKNEIKTVNKWIMSMIEADFICVLDTGSTDGTYEALLQWKNKFPNKIIIKKKEIIPWRFDVARNESLKLIPSNTTICMSTDLDEELIPGWSQDIKNKWTPDCTQCGYKYAWSHNNLGEPERVFWYNKIHSYGEWIWEYPVHESLKYIGKRELKKIYLNSNKIYLHHYPLEKERSSYLPLLELRNKENPNDAYSAVYLAHEYYYQKEYQKSIDFIMQTALPLILRETDSFFDIYKANIMLFLGKNFNKLGNNNKAKKCFSIGIQFDPQYRENYLELALLNNEEKKYDDSIKIIYLALNNSVRKYFWLEQDISWTYQPYDILSIAYYYKGIKNVALDYAKLSYSLDRTNERLKNNIEIIKNNL